MADDGLSRRQLLAVAGGGAIALGAGTQAYDSGSAPTITSSDSGIEQIGWTSDGDEVEGFEQERFVGGGEQVTNITSISFGGN